MRKRRWYKIALADLFCFIMLFCRRTGVERAAAEEDSWIKLTASEISTNNGVLVSGYYRLDEDVILPCGITVQNGNTVIFNLNGHVLQGDGTSDVISNAGTLTIVDSDTAAAHTGTISSVTVQFATGNITVKDQTTGQTTSLTEMSGEIWNWTPDSGGSTVLSGGIITGGNARGIYNTGTLYYKGGTIAGCSLSGDASGAGIYTTGAVDFSGGKITYCAARTESSGFTIGGGGIAVSKTGSLYISNDASIENCTAYCGGAVYVKGYDSTSIPRVEISGGSISGCAAFRGGALFTRGVFTMTGGILSGNISYQHGGAVFINDGTATISDGSISGNTTKVVGSMGGAIYNKGTLTVGGMASISGNYAQQGGAIVVGKSDSNTSTSSLSVEGSCLINENEAHYIGGAIMVNKGAVYIRGGTISGNYGQSGGAIHMEEGYAEVSGGYIGGNSSWQNGGGIYVKDGTVTLTVSGGAVTDNYGNRSGKTSDSGNHDDIYQAGGTLNSVGGEVGYLLVAGGTIGSETITSGSAVSCYTLNYYRDGDTCSSTYSIDVVGNPLFSLMNIITNKGYSLQGYEVGASDFLYSLSGAFDDGIDRAACTTFAALAAAEGDEITGNGSKESPYVINLYAIWYPPEYPVYEVVIPAYLSNFATDSNSNKSAAGTVKAALTGFLHSESLTIEITSENNEKLVYGDDAISVTYSLSSDSDEADSAVDDFSANASASLTSTGTSESAWINKVTLKKGSGHAATYNWVGYINAAINTDEAVYAGTYSDTLTFKVSVHSSLR